MNTEMQDEIAQAILVKEKRKANASAVLNRRASAFPAVVVTTFLVGLGSYFLSAEKFGGPPWIRVLLITAVAVSAANTVELSSMRRRLDAAIFLLQSQQDSKD